MAHMSARLARLLMLGVVISVPSVVLLCSLLYQPDRHQKSDIDEIDVLDYEPSTRTLNVVNATAMFSVRGSVDFDCPLVGMGSLSKRFPICTYADDHVSSFALNGEVFMASEIDAILRRLATMAAPAEDDDDDGRPTTFVDLGANIGSYSLPVAVAGHRVIAVEANYETARRLARAIQLGDLTDRVTLVNNAVTDRYGNEVSMFVATQNRGDSYIPRDSTSGCDGRTLRPGEFCQTTPVRTITLDDLLPLMTPGERAIMKVDIQGSEVIAFNRRTANKFLTLVVVQAIIMEWVAYIVTTSYDGSKYASNVGDSKKVKRFLKFARSLSYTFHDLNSTALDRNWRKWPYDILMLKKRK